jgi:NAD+ synthase (glutamine-hydrolysing)
MNYDFIKVSSAVPNVKVGDCKYNLEQIELLISRCESIHSEVVVFPELSITGYTCQDLFRQTALINAAEDAMLRLLEFTRKFDIIAIIGIPVRIGDLLMNCAAVIQHGKLLGLVPKTYLPNYGEFYEKRWFASSQELRPTPLRYAGFRLNVSSAPQLFITSGGTVFGVEICEDLWAPTPPSNTLALAGADIIFNLSASDELIGKHSYLKSLISQQSARTLSAYVYSSCGFGESTQDVVYGGNAMIYENGRLLAESKRFSTESQIVTAQIDVELIKNERSYNTTHINAQRPMAINTDNIIFTPCLQIESVDFSLERKVNPLPFIPSETDMNSSCEEILNIQAMGLAKRIVHTGLRHVIIGISGGLDSTLTLLVSVKAFDILKMSRKDIIGVTMPGFGTTGRTHDNSVKLMQSLGVTMKEINISQSVMQHFADIGHDASVQDVTYENSQARERTQILMDLSNQFGGLVIGTGDMSELALGWATYNGDHMSMYAVNSGVPKTLIRHLVKYFAVISDDDEIKSTLLDIINTPISPELIPAEDDGTIKQKTEDLVGPYELHDFFLFYFLRYSYSPQKIFLLAQKAFDGSDNRVSSFPKDIIKHWFNVFIHRFFSQQFKRSCMPDGPKVGSISLSPRGDWRMPSDASSNLWNIGD